jgi:hypothetical protein
MRARADAGEQVPPPGSTAGQPRHPHISPNPSMGSSHNLRRAVISPCSHPAMRTASPFRLAGRPRPTTQRPASRRASTGTPAAPAFKTRAGATAVKSASPPWTRRGSTTGALAFPVVPLSCLCTIHAPAGMRPKTWLSLSRACDSESRFTFRAKIDWDRPTEAGVVGARFQECGIAARAGPGKRPQAQRSLNQIPERRRSAETAAAPPGIGIPIATSHGADVLARCPCCPDEAVLRGCGRGDGMS